VKIVWFGHATFFAELDNKIRILFDPYDRSAYGSSFRYSGNFPKSDIVLISHKHNDHSFSKFKEKFGYQPVIIDTEGEHEILGVKIKGRRFFHDKSRGKERGEVIAFSVGTGKGSIIHFGDIGEDIDQGRVKDMADPYIAMVPVGGKYTLDGEEAASLMNFLSPRFVFPMHYKTDLVDFPIDNADNFISRMNNYKIKRVDSFSDDEEIAENTLFIFNLSNGLF
jgi:L-ascorbate metabolism protein UlaG (beta-lactamase superfamily)